MNVLWGGGCVVNFHTLLAASIYDKHLLCDVHNEVIVLCSIFRDLKELLVWQDLLDNLEDQ